MKKNNKLFQYKKLFVIPILIILQLLPLHSWEYANAVAAVVTGADTTADTEAAVGVDAKAEIKSAAGADSKDDTEPTAGADSKTDTEDTSSIDSKDIDTETDAGSGSKIDAEAIDGADIKTDEESAGANSKDDAVDADVLEEDEDVGGVDNSFSDQIKQPHSMDSSSCDVIIDGYFDDWENKPLGKLSWNSNNGNAHHDVAFIKDSDSIYIYVRLHPSYHSTMPLDNIYLSVNNNERTLFIGNAYAQTVYLGRKGTYLDLHPFIYGSNTSLGSAAVTLANGHRTDQMEIQISISALEYAMGLKPGTINSGAQLELRMPNLGNQSILLLGTSTGAIPGVLLCIGIVMAVRLYRSRKVRKV